MHPPWQEFQDTSFALRIAHHRLLLLTFRSWSWCLCIQMPFGGIFKRVRTSADRRESMARVPLQISGIYLHYMTLHSGPFQCLFQTASIVGMQPFMACFHVGTSGMSHRSANEGQMILWPLCAVSRGSQRDLIHAWDQRREMGSHASSTLVAICMPGLLHCSWHRIALSLIPPPSPHLNLQSPPNGKFFWLHDSSMEDYKKLSPLHNRSEFMPENKHINCSLLTSTYWKKLYKSNSLCSVITCMPYFLVTNAGPGAEEIQ